MGKIVVVCFFFCWVYYLFIRGEKRVKSQDEMQHNKLHFIRPYTACKDKTTVGKKNTQFFFFVFF